MATTQYIVYLDRKVELTGVYSAGTTTWTLPFTDNTLNCIVPGFTAGAAVDGTPVTPTSNSAGSVTKTGDYSGGVCTIGRTYAASFELSPPLAKTRDGLAVLPLVATIKRLVFAHRRAGSYTITCIRPTAMGNKTTTFTSTGIVDNFGRFTAWLGGHSTRNRFTISDSSPKPMVIAGIDVVYDPSQGAF